MSSIAEIISNREGVNASFLDEAMRRVEAIKAVLFVWHPYMPLNNLGADTFRFNYPRPVLHRLEPLPVTTVERADIHSRGRNSLGMTGVSNFRGTGASLEGDVLGAGGFVPSGQGAIVKQEQQRPAETVIDILQAWSKVGMVELQSLAASDENELILSYKLYDVIFKEAETEEHLEIGRRPVSLVLEDYPLWLERSAPRVLEHALRSGLPATLEKKGERLIAEASQGVARAHVFVLDPENGILPKTRKGLQVAKQGGLEGKTHLDRQDMWCLEQFPSFQVNPDAERAERALAATIEKGSESAESTNAGLLAIVEQNQTVIGMLAEQQRQTNELIQQVSKRK